jgi:hypothetical protein
MRAQLIVVNWSWKVPKGLPKKWGVSMINEPPDGLADPMRHQFTRGPQCLPATNAPSFRISAGSLSRPADAVLEIALEKSKFQQSVTYQALEPFRCIGSSF